MVLHAVADGAYAAAVLCCRRLRIRHIHFLPTSAGCRGGLRYSYHTTGTGRCKRLQLGAHVLPQRGPRTEAQPAAFHRHLQATRRSCSCWPMLRHTMQGLLGRGNPTSCTTAPTARCISLQDASRSSRWQVCIQIESCAERKFRWCSKCASFYRALENKRWACRRHY